MGHARALLALEHIEQQLWLAKEIREKQLSVRATEELVKNLQKKNVQTPRADIKSPAGLAPAYKRIEDQLASHLSTKVVLERKKNGKGSITVEFYNDEDLERILDKIRI